MTSCVHCDEDVLSALFDDADIKKENPFCCHGCLTVYQVLHQKGLGSYYEIKQLSGIYKRRSPIEAKSYQFTYLDDPDFIAEFSFKNNFGEQVMEFYLEGIHCLACLWLIEKLPEFLTSVISSKLDLDRSVVTVFLKNGGHFSEVARELNNLGYRPHPLKKNQTIADFKIKEERAALLRIGVAGAAAGNIMIYAVSLYGGASAGFAQLFNSLTVFFAIPVLTYSAYPFYKNAWNALKNKTLSIDIPISISLIFGGVMGLYNLVEGVPDNYFDSLTALVFLLLLSRYFLHKIQEKGLAPQDLHFFYHSESVLKLNSEKNDDFIEVHPKFIKQDDVLKIRSGEFIPADGIIIQGTSNLNNSLLTGESFPVRVNPGEKVYTGTQNLNNELLIKVESTQESTRLGQILKNVENGWVHKSQIVNLSSKVSKYFTLAVFLLSAILFYILIQKGDTKYALEHAITLLIVTCPCALALAIPLTFTRALSKASEQGIIIKSDEVIEKLSKIETIFLDKTGTITHGKLKISNFTILHDPALPAEDIIYSLEQYSKHPVAIALLDFVKLGKVNSLQVEDFKEVIGLGVSGNIEGRYYEINRAGVFENGLHVISFMVEDTVRGDSKKVLKDLAKHKLRVKILSGDQSRIVNKIADNLGLSHEMAISELSPDQKSQMIKNTPHSMMVGDGANDAIALSHADVGVAVMGAMDISLRAADVYLTTPGLVPVEKLVILSKETMKVIRRNLILSLTYNSLSVAAAFSGLITPLVAAIIMPLSSLTVLLSTLAGTKKLRALWK